MFRELLDGLKRKRTHESSMHAPADSLQPEQLTAVLEDIPHIAGAQEPDTAPTRLFRAQDLDAFIAQSDALGGPDSPDTQAYWQGMHYQPGVDVTPGHDPFSEDYVRQQVALWEELSGRSFNQDINELCDFPFDKHLEAANPYARRDVSGFAHHLASLANVAIASDLPFAPRILDLGCGWGLTSEVFAFLGADVTAMDIGQGFVDLVNARGERLALPMQAFRSTFEEFEPYAVFDMVLFYECLHHAVRPWEVLERFRHHLGEGGKIVLAREPVQEYWWAHWGMRLDPLSIYCMRKFGWFESGFSIAFLKAMADRLGLELEERPDPYASFPLYILRFPSERPQQKTIVPLHGLVQTDRHEGWAQETANRLVAEHRVTIDLSALVGGDYLELELENNRGRPLRLTLHRDEKPPVRVSLRPGSNILRVKREGRLIIDAETWKPADELDIPDPRTISFHLLRAETYGETTP